jgi:hypothetical protein
MKDRTVKQVQCVGLLVGAGEWMEEMKVRVYG